MRVVPKISDRLGIPFAYCMLLDASGLENFQKHKILKREFSIMCLMEAFDSVRSHNENNSSVSRKPCPDCKL